MYVVFYFASLVVFCIVNDRLMQYLIRRCVLDEDGL